MKRLRVIELFAGIGGAARAFENCGDIAAAIDINQNAKQVYELNFRHPYLIHSIESLKSEQLRSFDADTWWVSAPCQPFTRRGNQRDDLDPRSAALLHLIEIMADSRPDFFLLENVVGFMGSNTHRHLISQLQQQGYSFAELERCPTELGIPNRRPRYYLMASRSIRLATDIFALDTRKKDARPIGNFLQESASEDFYLSADDWSKYGDGLNVVDRNSDVSNCLTSAYGRSLTKSGSYLRESDGRIRRFTPIEVSRLLGIHQPEYGREFDLPKTFTNRQLWKLIGNSISIFVLQDLLNRIQKIL